MTRLQGTQHAIHVQRSTWHRDTMHGQVFLYSNDHTASTKSDSNNTSGQSRLSLVAPVVHRTPELEQGSGVVVPLVLARHRTPELEQGSGVVVPLVLVRHALHVAQKFNDANTQNQKRWKLILMLLTTETNTKLEQWWYSTEEKLKQWWYSTERTTHETRAMVVLNTKLEQWWYSTRNSSNGGTQQKRNSSNGGTQQKRNSSNGGTQHRMTPRDNQTCVKSGLQPRIRRGSSGYRKNGSGSWPQPRPPTDL